MSETPTIPDDILDAARRVANSMNPMDGYSDPSRPRQYIAEALLAERLKERELIATYIEQRPGSLPDRQELARAIRSGCQ